MTTQSDIEALAQKTALEAAKDDTPLQSKIDALKALASYYLSLAKRNGVGDLSDEPTIGDIQRNLRVVQEDDDGRTQGGGELHSRSRGI